jgi:hypothetical protein
MELVSSIFLEDILLNKISGPNSSIVPTSEVHTFVLFIAGKLNKHKDVVNSSSMIFIQSVEKIRQPVYVVFQGVEQKHRHYDTLGLSFIIK